MERDDHLTPEELREALGISEATYFRWLKDGKLKGRRAGKNWRFPRALVDQLLSDGTTQTDVKRDVLTAVKTYESLLLAQGLAKDEVTAMARGDAKSGGKSGGQALVRMMLEHAVASRASTVHIDQAPDGVSVRERIDGALAAVTEPLPKGAARELLQAFKDLAGIDSAARLADGRFTATVAGRKVYVSASTYPSARGESLTLQLLDVEKAVSSLDDFGFAGDQLDEVRAMLRAPSGAVIVTGPHGCGKTSTIYAMLHELAKDPNLKIMTAEASVEFELDGVQQAAVDGADGIGFARALEAMLRADLDVGMIGEFRDGETLDLFFKAAHTGHLMLGLMHAPDPIVCLKTILDVGRVPPPLVTANLRGIVTQRLFRRSCPHCRELRPVAAEDADALGLAGDARKLKASYNKGCDKCRGTGFKGRTMVADVFTLEGRLAGVIESGAFARDAAELSVAWRGRLRDRLLDKVRQGVVSPREAAIYQNT